MDTAAEVERQRRLMAAEEAERMAHYYTFLSNLTGYSETGYGVAINYLTEHKKRVELLLGEIKTLFSGPNQKRQPLWRIQ